MPMLATNEAEAHSWAQSRSRDEGPAKLACWTHIYMYDVEGGGHAYICMKEVDDDYHNQAERGYLPKGSRLIMKYWNGVPHTNSKP